MKYCDDAHCPKFVGFDCKLGLDVVFRTPKSYGDVNTHNWGWVMAKNCILNRSAKERTVRGGSLEELFSKLEKKAKGQT